MEAASTSASSVTPSLRSEAAHDLLFAMGYDSNGDYPTTNDEDDEMEGYHEDTLPTNTPTMSAPTPTTTVAATTTTNEDSNNDVLTEEQARKLYVPQLKIELRKQGKS